MPLLRAKPLPKVPEAEPKGEESIRFYIKETRTYVIETPPGIKTIYYRTNEADEFQIDDDTEFGDLRSYKIAHPWIYFLNGYGGRAIVFADHRIRTIYEGACHDAPFPNVSAEDGNFSICMPGRHSSTPASTLKAHSVFWKSHFNGEYQLESHERYPAALGGSRVDSWMGLLSRWQKLTIEKRADEILWVPLFRWVCSCWQTIRCEGGCGSEPLRRLHSLHSVSLNFS